ncbi:hypothetical protein SMG44B_20547 [Stenotrophomonas maltophilia]|nr:hypothetical protein BN1263480005 [Stenotrophomonas maltophilia]
MRTLGPHTSACRRAEPMLGCLLPASRAWARLYMHSQFATPARLGWFSTERGRVTNPATFGTVVVS